MALSCSGGEASRPYQPVTYREDKDIPFAPDGNSSLIWHSVEKVIGVSGRFQHLKCARKTFLVPIKMDEMARHSLKQRVIQEAKILHLAWHCHVVRLVHTYFEELDGEQMKYAVIMDRADSNLHTYLEFGKLPPPQWFGCLISVVHHIHTLGIRHRDIKPSNILIKEGKVLLADFGISQMGLGQTMPTTNQARQPSRTQKYCAPEVDRGSTRGRSADIFSLGAVFLEMLVALNDPKYSTELSKVLTQSSGSASYAQNIDGIDKWIEGSFHPTDWQRDFLRTCRKMLDQERYRRPSAKNVQLSWSSSPLLEPSMICNCARDLDPTTTERLIEACQKGSDEDVKRLLNQRIKPMASEAIHYAAARGSVTIVQVLLDAGVQIDAPNPVGQTALHCAARNGCSDVIQQLLMSNANVNARDENEQTALHGAAAQGYESIVRMLLEAKADVFAEDLDGETAICLADRRHHTTVQALLEEYAEESVEIC